MVGVMTRQKSLKEGGALLQMSGRKTCRQTQSLGMGLGVAVEACSRWDWFGN